MSRPRKPSERLRQALPLALPYGIAALVLAGLKYTNYLEQLDLYFYDWASTARPKNSSKGQPITIVTIDDPDIKQFGWPIDDGALCDGITRAAAQGASAIGLDLYRDVSVGPRKKCLSELIRREPRLISIFNEAENVAPIAHTPTTQQAYNDLIVDPDGVMRRDLVHVTGLDERTISLPMRLAELHTGSKSLRSSLEDLGSPISNDAWLWLSPESGGYRDLGEDNAGGYQRMINFKPPSTFKRLSLRQLINDPPAQLKPAIYRRIVLIGLTARSDKAAHDSFIVPSSRFLEDKNLAMFPGVEIHALRTAALLDDIEGLPAWTVTAPVQVERAVEVLALIGGAALGLAFGGLRASIVSTSAIAVALGGTALWLLCFLGLWLGIALPIGSLLLMAAVGWVRRALLNQQQRQQVQRLLGQTTSPAVAQQLWEQRDELLQDGRFEGRQLPVTILFSDTCSFTSVSERLTPAELLAWLNRGMALAVPAVTRRGGMVNKFTGDGMLAVFGAPISHGEANDARAAIEAALELQRGLETLNQQLQAEGAPAMRMRVGIHSGLVLAGSMGSSERLEYAVIGDAVNCASRLESLEKERHDLCCRVLVSSTTRALYDADALQWLEWGPLHVKGRQEPLQVSELRGSSAPGPGVLSPGSSPAAGPANRR